MRKLMIYGANGYTAADRARSRQNAGPATAAGRAAIATEVRGVGDEVACTARLRTVEADRDRAQPRRTDVVCIAPASVLATPSDARSLPRAQGALLDITGAIEMFGLGHRRACARAP